MDDPNLIFLFFNTPIFIALRENSNNDRAAKLQKYQYSLKQYIALLWNWNISCYQVLNALTCQKCFLAVCNKKSKSEM